MISNSKYMINNSDINILYKFIPKFPTSSVWLVGAGPGHVGIISIMGLFALKQADIIIYDSLVNKDFLQFIRSDAKAIYAGKRGGKPSIIQKDITDLIVKYAKEGNRVLRLKGGDPFIFGRGGEEVESLSKANIKFLVIPGVTAGIGGLAFACIPITTRKTNQYITFLTGHDSNGIIPNAINWNTLACSSQVIVMYMALKNIGDICSHLIRGKRNKNESIVFIRNVTLKNQQVWETTLNNAANFVIEQNITPPVIIIIGSNIMLRKKILSHALSFYPEI